MRIRISVIVGSRQRQRLRLRLRERGTEDRHTWTAKNRRGRRGRGGRGRDHGAGVLLCASASTVETVGSRVGDALGRGSAPGALLGFRDWDLGFSDGVPG